MSDRRKTNSPISNSLISHRSLLKLQLDLVVFLEFFHAVDLDVAKQVILMRMDAITDEYHQSFVPFRSPSVWDVLVFDNLGALLSLWSTNVYINKQKTTKQ